jgi:hypothetical protein
VHLGRQHGPRHPRHHDVGDDGIEAARVVLKAGPGLGPITRFYDSVASLLKSTDKDVPDRSVVIDQEDRAPGRRLCRRGHAVHRNVRLVGGPKPI